MMRNGRGAVVESCVPGRIRFRLPQEERREDVLGGVESALRQLQGVVDVTANLCTGSVLVKHDPTVLPESLLVDYARRSNILSGAAGQAEPEAVLWSQSSQLARSIAGELKRMDQFVSRVSRGTVDGKTAAAIVLFGTSLTRAMFDKRQIPAPWYALLWYAYSLFMQWNKNSEGINSV